MTAHKNEPDFVLGRNEHYPEFYSGNIDGQDISPGLGLDYYGSEAIVSAFVIEELSNKELSVLMYNLLVQAEGTNQELSEMEETHEDYDWWINDWNHEKDSYEHLQEVFERRGLKAPINLETSIETSTFKNQLREYIENPYLELVTNTYERYQSVIALAEGAFDPFGYLETADSKEAEEMGLDLTVHEAIWDSPMAALSVYENQVKFVPDGASFSYALVDETGRLLGQEPNLDDLVGKDSFKAEVAKQKDVSDVTGQVNKLIEIIKEAMSETQSFMDEEAYWSGEIPIPSDDDYLLDALDKLQAGQLAVELHQESINIHEKDQEQGLKR